MAEIDINSITGMNNLSTAFFAEKDVAVPKVVLNADIDATGKVSKRDGMELFLSLPGAHSLWACDRCMICSAGGFLYNVSTGAAITLCSVAGPQEEPFSCLLLEDRVYISNHYWRGIFDIKTSSILDWGIIPPSGPVLITGAGGLPPGTYYVTLTTLSNNELSGNGTISSITLTTTGGITLLSRPPNTLVWTTDKDGHVFTLSGDVDTIVEPPSIEPLPSFMCSPPPNLNCLAHAFGRVWGADGASLVYSEPFQPGWFKPTSNSFTFDSPITLVAPVSTGIFIGMEESTIFLSGTEPTKMSQVRAGAGSVRGTLAYCNNLPELGDVLGTPEKGYVDVPVWRTNEGIVAGNITGRLFNLTKHKINMGSPISGASLYRQKDGKFQFLTSSLLSNGGDVQTTETLNNGLIQANNIFSSPGSSNANVVEEVSCDHRRGGVLI